MKATAAYFDRLYRADPDPWKTRDLWYETRKRAIVLASMHKPHYEWAFEPGCGAGELTRGLCERCAHVVACDYSPTAVAFMKGKFADRSHVFIECRTLPAQWPAHVGNKFDLIVVSELAYYLDDKALAVFIAQCEASLAGGGELVACHWLHPFGDRIQDTETAHRQFHEQTQLHHLTRHRENDFLLDVWEKKPEESMPMESA